MYVYINFYHVSKAKRNSEREREIYIYISLEQYMYMIYALIRIYNTRNLDTSPAFSNSTYVRTMVQDLHALGSNLNVPNKCNIRMQGAAIRSEQVSMTFACAVICIFPLASPTTNGHGCFFHGRKRPRLFLWWLETPGVVYF